MKITMEFDLPDEQHDYNRMYFAGDAWSAIDEALNIIRNHVKHDAQTPAEVIDNVRSVLGEAWGRLE